jgi:glutaredoxin
VFDPARLTIPDIVTVYGRDTCDDTTRARRHFEQAGLLFHYVNIDENPDALAEVHEAGYFHTPVVVTPAGRVDMEPSDRVLGEIVASSGPAGG